MLLVGTRAMQLLRGVLIIGFIGAVANILELRSLSWIIGKMLGAFIIVVPVLFQPELRHMLEELGKGHLWKVGRNEEDIDLRAEQLSKALTYCKSQRIGALCVLQRDTSLKEVWRTAVMLKADITEELLISIFWPGTPLHDGAVIVRAGRIVGAGCMLPMSGNVNLSRELGMRHRAGIGASEHTDAVVAIVSEETGSISVAVGGMLKRHLAPETLERLLRNELLPERENDEAASKFKLGNLLRFGKGKKQDGNENS